MQTDEFGPAPDRQRAQDSRGTQAHRAVRPGSATAITRYQYTLSAVLIALVVTAVGLFLLTDSRISDLEARLDAQIALLSAPPAPADTSHSTAAINGLHDRIDDLQALLDDLRAQSDAGREPEATPANAATGAKEAAPATEAGTVAAKAEVAPPQTPIVTTGEPAAAQAPQGEWLINIASFSQQTAAQQLQGKLRALGKNATTEPVNLNGKALYRVRVIGLADRKAAEEEAQRLQQALQLSGFWVSRQEN